MLRNTSDVVQQIDIPSIDPCTNKVTSDAGFELICTYNWIEQTKKKNNGQEIYVPGCPPKWLPHQLPVKLQPDQGAQYVDQNAYRLPQYPFEPIFWALDIMNPHARLNDVDIVCNRNSLRKLLDLASGRRPDPFVMHLHLLQETLFITRKERNARNMIRGGGQSGYGHNFEKAFTEADDDVHGSTSHHRVVSYDMGGLNCMVRFEVDAYYDEATDGVQDKTFDHTVLLEDAMQRLSLVGEPEPEPEPSFPFPTNRPKAFRKGVLLPSSAMAEIKTHGRRSKPLSQLLPQLWFGRTPHLLVGRHPAANGVFTEVEHTHAGSEFSAWEQENQAALRRLVGILKHLKEVVGGLQPAAAILLYQTKGGPLQVRRMKAPTEVLPECTRRYWSAN
ncbi:hypothetical protein K504DRAFT_391633 [Pleomassaria siparia CBS 279.74]|uniref:RAI1-like domain-containing protein n=1 Tax=Pleomassaria siparia CBS 279.74 TaxID=1314801 RepID=A0A6G1JU56_9PLEO|nr:hypothetical protein K504DRAFT_391633 [Pleomassaria siparia CBS 279.74]